MKRVTVGTFNVENLFARFKFNKNINVDKVVKNGWTVNDSCFSLNDVDSKQITGDAINAISADILALQEVENLDTLKRFRNMYLGGKDAYPYTIAIDGNDPRKIDVAILSRYRIKNIESFMHLWSKEFKTNCFSRDCLRVEVEIEEGKTLTLFINHLKSMLDKDHPKSGREYTKERRIEQSKMVVQLVSDHFKDRIDSSDFIILGDFNDYIEEGKEDESGIVELVFWDKVNNIINNLSENERWTHYYSKDKEYRQLDYILISNHLLDKVKDIKIERRGLPLRANTGSDERFDNVGKNSPKASDHCPFCCVLEI